MTASAARRSAGERVDGRLGGWLRAYFWSDAPRRVQTVLGLIWLLDGGLQFQSFMYSRGFVQVLAGGAQGQPGWLADSINWGARLANGNLTVFNTLFALSRCDRLGAALPPDGQAGARRFICLGVECGGSARRSGCCS